MLALGNVGAQSIVALASLILARLYTPGDFGIAASYTSLLSVCTIVATCRLEMAINIPRSERCAYAVVRLGIWVAIVTSGAMLALAAIIPISMYNGSTFGTLAPYRWALPAGMLCIGIYQIAYQLTLRRQDFGTIARSRIIQATGSAGVSIGWGIVHPSVWGLLFAQIAQQALGMRRLLACHWRGGARALLQPRWTEGLRYSFLRYWRFGAATTGTALLNIVGTAVLPVAVLTVYGDSIAGYFNLAFRMVTLPVAIVGSGFAQVFYSEASRLVREKSGDVHVLFWSTVRPLAVVGCLLAVAGQLCPALFPIIFGPQWKISGEFALYLALAAAVQIAVSPVSMTAIILQRQRVQACLDATRAVLVCAVFYCAAQYRLDPLTAIRLLAGTLIANQILYFCFYNYMVKSYEKTKRFF